MARPGRADATAVALLAMIALSACTTAAPKPVVSASASASATATPSAAPAPTPDPTFDASGTAAANKNFFDFVNNRLFAANGAANGRDIIDTLVNSGFAKAEMQVTPDKTSINGQVDSVLFSVKLGDSCLLGQHGGGGYTSAVQPALQGGHCLIGKTRPIDW